jgi:glycosyltransferase involved in cell wall biosynthesis
LKISIITSVFNGDATLSDAIESVINQTFNNVEYIIVDGKSTDGTISIIRNYEDSISKFISEKDAGIYDGINKGVRMATGQIVGILHADDVFADNNLLKNVAREFRDEKELDGLYGDLVYTKKNDISRVVRYWKSKPFVKNDLYFGWMPPHPTLFLKKDVFERIGYYKRNYSISADYEFILRMFSSNVKVKYVPKVFYKMRSGGVSNNSFKNIVYKSVEDLRALKKK